MDATARLVAQGLTPSVDDVAAAADVSRRTVYSYFPTLDQLLLDATLGALTATTMDAVPPADDTTGDTGDTTAGSGDPRAAALDRVDALMHSLTATADTTLPLGRKIIALTVDAPAPSEDQPRRGYRRVEWVERAVAPLRDVLDDEQHARLVAALAVVAGWESMIVLRDVCGLEARREDEVLRWVAASLVRAMLDEVARGAPPPEASRP
ncbi:regulatory TetR family protein [Motilibacter peucedani]|uniref:Regulatory TetR family protein n=1 Tax=Motilibacter peucedani TaxID=598650 RepID=A0A420XSZ4_9ACTN|nr:regulatory TetR family protein [Motilibacter peucedani]